MPCVAPREYNEYTVSHALARQIFKDYLVVVDNCMWPGSECDLLCVTKTLRIVDVEIKVSRADLKADRGKDKWYRYLGWEQQRALAQQLGRRPTHEECRTPRDWPRRVWKHYYAVAAPIWKDELLALCNPASGVYTVELKIDEYGRRSARVNIKRRAKPNRDHQTLTPVEAIEIARLASLRMWDAYDRMDSERHVLSD